MNSKIQLCWKRRKKSEDLVNLHLIYFSFKDEGRTEKAETDGKWKPTALNIFTYTLGYCRIKIIESLLQTGHFSRRLCFTSVSFIFNRSRLLGYSWMTDSISSRSYIYPKQIRQQRRTSVSLSAEKHKSCLWKNYTSDHRNNLFNKYKMWGRTFVFVVH